MYFPGLYLNVYTGNGDICNIPHPTAAFQQVISSQCSALETGFIMIRQLNGPNYLIAVPSPAEINMNTMSLSYWRVIACFCPLELNTLLELS